MKKWIESGEKLPSAAKVLAVSSYVTFSNNYPIVRRIKPERWDFVLTVGGIFMAASQLNHENISEDDEDALLDRITNAAVKIYPDSVDACDDCRGFVDRAYDGLAKEAEYRSNPQYLFSDCLGGWVVWNLFGHAPSNEDERQLVRELGGFLVHSFVSWWQ